MVRNDRISVFFSILKKNENDFILIDKNNKLQQYGKGLKGIMHSSFIGIEIDKIVKDSFKIMSNKNIE